MSTSSLEFLRSVLLCPSTSSELEIKDGALYSPAAKKAFMNIDEIPWVFHRDQENLLQWHTRVTSLIDYHKILSERTAGELRQVDLLKSTRIRLEQLQQHHVMQVQHLTEINRDLLTKVTNDLPDIIKTLFYEKVPRQQTANAYAQTVYRDWAWGEREIAAQAELLRPQLDSTKNLLVLGAGACGLPAHLHKTLKFDNTLAVDINPILLSTAQHILQGKDLELIEFPRIPVESKYAAMKHSVKGQKLNNFHFVFADAQDLALKPGAFDTLLTPWFIDIVPRTFLDLAAKMNQHLSNGQKWVNIGLLGFEKNRQSDVYGPDEIKEALASTGFELKSWEIREIPYLYSPYSAVKRTDSVFVFSATKIKGTKQPPRYHYLPEWLVDTSLPIPKDEAMTLYQFKSDLYLRIFSLIDGEANLEQVAAMFAIQTQMPPDGARVSIFNFLVNAYENVIYREF